MVTLVAQIPQCNSPISHNAPSCNRNVHVSAHFCNKNGTLWDICLMHCGIYEISLLPQLKFLINNSFLGITYSWISINYWSPQGGRGCEVSCGGHRWQREKTTTGSAVDGAVLDFSQILAYLVHKMSRSQLYLGFGHFGWLPSFSNQWHFGGFMVKLYFICWNYSLSSAWHIIAS